MSIGKPNGLPMRPGVALPEGQKPSLDKKFREVSQLYEKQFMREMVKAMRSTVHESDFIKVNQAEKIFREQLDDEYVDKWSAQGGVGFADIIYDQLIDKYGSMMGKQLIQKPNGPLPVNEKNNTSVKFELTQNAESKKMDMTLTPDKKIGESPAVTSPWAGTLLNRMALGDDSQVLDIDHGNGLLGRYVFKGWSPELNSGAQIKSGQLLGKLSPDANSLFWSIRNQTQQSGPEPKDSAGE